MKPRVGSTSSRRRLWLPLALTVAFIWYYRRSHHSSDHQPRWNVVDFRVNNNEDAYIDDAAPYFEGHGSYPGAHSHFDHQRHRDHFAEIEEIRNQHSFHQQQIKYDNLQDKIQQFIQWDRPSTNHWPAWHDYDDADYDPNRWEGLERFSACSRRLLNNTDRQQTIWLFL